MTLAFLLYSTISSVQAVPLQLTQQGRILDSSGAAVTGLHDVTFRIFTDATSGTQLWSEPIAVNFTNGYYAAVLGADEQNNPLDSDTLTQYPIYLELQLDSNSPMTPRQAINSAPYAQIAGEAEMIDGGFVNASEVQVAGSAVIDSGGNWVGPPMTVDWNDIDTNTIPSYITDGDDNTQNSEPTVEGYITNGALTFAAGSEIGVDGQILGENSTLDWANIDGSTIPAGLSDGDDDSLANLSCSAGEIAGWTGSAWACVSDATVDANDLGNMLNGNTYDLNAGSTIGGADIMTANDETLSSLNCLDGEFARWDGITSQWYCDSDSLEQLNCSDGEVVTYNSSSGGWICTNPLSLFDVDGDGVMSWMDCNDNNASITTTTAEDGDCDGTLTADDCDDSNPSSTIVATDADCDGVLTADDCNDNDANSTIVVNDADCDGTETADDCDDNDASSTIVANDADCDGLEVGIDCDDNDPTANVPSGMNAVCAAQSCNEILTNNSSSTSGVYYVNPDGLGVNQVYCDMTLDGGGWTLVYINNNDSGINDDSTGTQGNVTSLQSATGGSAKFSDAYINAIREYSDNRIGYRVSSNNLTERYFVPSDCTYQHTNHSDSNCRQYTATYTSSTSPSYIQCTNWGGNSGGLDAWYQCNGSGYTNVFNTHRDFGSTGGQTSGITTNSSGGSFGAAWNTYVNDVLMWVR